MRDRIEAAKHAGELEMVTELSIKAWQAHSQRFAELISLGIRDEILASVRNTAIDSYEAMLDAVKCEADAHRMLQALRDTDARRRRQPPRKPGGTSPKA